MPSSVCGTLSSPENDDSRNLFPKCCVYSHSNIHRADHSELRRIPCRYCLANLSLISVPSPPPPNKKGVVPLIGAVAISAAMLALGSNAAENELCPASPTMPYFLMVSDTPVRTRFCDLITCSVITCSVIRCRRGIHWGEAIHCSLEPNLFATRQCRWLAQYQCV